jgi:hypothetical protein
MNWYQVVLFVHILGVLGLFMALAVELASMLGARRAHTIEAVRVWSSARGPLAIMFPVTSLLILCAGLAMTLDVWGWGHAWIDLSLALLILLSVMGARVNGTHAKRIAERAAALGALGIVFLMVEKPGWLGSVVTLVIGLLVGVILAQVLVRSGQTLVSTQDVQHAEEQATELSTKA